MIKRVSFLTVKKFEEKFNCCYVKHARMLRIHKLDWSNELKFWNLATKIAQWLRPNVHEGGGGQ